MTTWRFLDYIVSGVPRPGHHLKSPLPISLLPAFEIQRWQVVGQLSASA